MAFYNLVLAAVIALGIFALCRADLISDVCSQSFPYEGYCNEFLRLDPRSKLNQTYRLLAEMSIDKGLRQSSKVAGLARAVSYPGNDVLMQGCAVYMDEAVKSLEVAKFMLKTVNKDNKSRQEALEEKVLDIMASAIQCDSDVMVVRQPPILKRNTQGLMHVVTVIGITVSMLIKSMISS